MICHQTDLAATYPLAMAAQAICYGAGFILYEIWLRIGSKKANIYLGCAIPLFLLIASCLGVLSSSPK